MKRVYYSAFSPTGHPSANLPDIATPLILSAATTVLALAAACGVAATVWLLNRRAEFIFDLSAAKGVVARSIALGKWLLSGQLAMQAQGYAAHWITLAIGGAVTTGLYSACLSTALPCGDGGGDELRQARREKAA
ncbi:MAG: hypothetical protein AB7F09_18900 [Parvibaculaceae bacterium]